VICPTCLLRNGTLREDAVPVTEPASTPISVREMLLGPWSRAVEPRWTDQCHQCKEYGHFQRDCPKRAQKRPTGKKHWKKGMKGGGGGGQQKWCSYHNTTNHADSECNKQKELKELKGLAANIAWLKSAAQATPSLLVRHLPLRVRLRWRPTPNRRRLRPLRQRRQLRVITYLKVSLVRSWRLLRICLRSPSVLTDHLF